MKLALIASEVRRMFQINGNKEGFSFKQLSRCIDTVLRNHVDGNKYRSGIREKVLYAYPFLHPTEVKRLKLNSGMENGAVKFLGHMVASDVLTLGLTFDSESIEKVIRRITKKLVLGQGNCGGRSSKRTDT